LIFGTLSLTKNASLPVTCRLLAMMIEFLSFSPQTDVHKMNNELTPNPNNK